MRDRVTLATRRQFLGVLGAAQLGVGVSYIDTSSARFGRARGFEWLPLLEPAHIGWLMVATGALCVLAVLVGVRGRGARLERLAFAFALVPYLLLALVYLGASLWGGHATGWVSAMSYAAWAGFVWLAAGVVDPPKREGHPRGSVL